MSRILSVLSGRVLAPRNPSGHASFLDFERRPFDCHKFSATTVASVSYPFVSHFFVWFQVRRLDFQWSRPSGIAFACQLISFHISIEDG